MDATMRAAFITEPVTLEAVQVGELPVSGPTLILGEAPAVNSAVTL